MSGKSYTYMAYDKRVLSSGDDAKNSTVKNAV